MLAGHHSAYVEFPSGKEEDAPDGPVLLGRAGAELLTPGTTAVVESAGGVLCRRSAPRAGTDCRTDTHLVLPRMVGAEPVGRGTTGLHLCQICTAEPYGGQRISYVSTVDTDTTPLEGTGEGKTALESDEDAAEVEKGAELAVCQPRGPSMIRRRQTLSW
jgi:hypothetical protein